MTRTAKLRLVTVLLILTLISAGVLVDGYLRPATTQASTVVCRFVHRLSLDYQVYLRPNSLYDTPSLGPGQKIFAGLVDHIEARIGYDMNSDRQADSSGTYTVVADVQTDDWQKQIVLLPDTPFSSSGTSLSVDKEFPLDLASLAEIVKTIAEETGVSPVNPRTVITATFTASVATGLGVGSATMSATMSLPLSAKSYNVVISNPDPQNGSVTEKVTVDRESVHGQRRYSLIALVLLLAAFVAVGILPMHTTMRVEDRDEWLIKQSKANRKKYGDRLATVTTVAYSKASGIVGVKTVSLKDLVVIADEIGKPILLKEASSSKDLPIYHVLDGSVCYQWALTPPSPSDEP